MIIFYLYSHGGVGSIFDERVSKISNDAYPTPRSINKLLTELNPAFTKFANDKTLAFTLFLLACNSATEHVTGSIAKKMSLDHPNSTIIGFEGFVFFASNNPIPTGVSSNQLSNDNKGYIVIYKKGKVLTRKLYSEYVNEILIKTGLK